MSVRLEKINEEIKNQLSRIIHQQYDQKLGLISVTRVETAPDLSFCKIFVSSYQFSQKNDFTATLNKDQKKIRHLLAQNIILKYTPKLVFEEDSSIAYAAKIENIIQNIKNNKK